MVFLYIACSILIFLPIFCFFSIYVLSCTHILERTLIFVKCAVQMCFIMFIVIIVISIAARLLLILFMTAISKINAQVDGNY